MRCCSTYEILHKYVCDLQLSDISSCINTKSEKVAKKWKIKSCYKKVWRMSHVTCDMT